MVCGRHTWDALCYLFYHHKRAVITRFSFFGFFILSSVIYLMRKRQRRRHESYLKFREEEKRFFNLNSGFIVWCFYTQGFLVKLQRTLVHILEGWVHNL